MFVYNCTSYGILEEYIKGVRTQIHIPVCILAKPPEVGSSITIADTNSSGVEFLVTEVRSYKLRKIPGKDVRAEGISLLNDYRDRLVNDDMYRIAFFGEWNKKFADTNYAVVCNPMLWAVSVQSIKEGGV